MTVELFNTDPYLRACEGTVQTVDRGRRCFTADQTVFYPLGGGQPGDAGCAFFANDLDIAIIDTRRNPDTGEVEHFIDEISPLPADGERLHLELDWERRHAHMRMHSCIHLLCAVVSGRVTGNQVHAGRGRVDFDLAAPLDKEQITYSLNALISQDADRVSMEYSYDEIAADRSFFNSLSFPPPKIDGPIRLVHFEGIDIQPCGGTHVANTSEIGPARITKIDSKGKHNKRMSIALEP